ncbi:hypothetical protein WH47_11140 [Habropoda laboriosa]|uniref:Uncharacterized protein n=1 Tax=Habropoda laboriosa TaxID=597456 RepID=A0A0L7RA74_9HYME|nr:hypothetical protein WH47_11140 [Habropoda laboriosa]
MFWLHCGLFVLVIAVPGFISSADSTSKRGNACLFSCLPALLFSSFLLLACLPACLPVYLFLCLPTTYPFTTLVTHLSLHLYAVNRFSRLTTPCLSLLINTKEEIRREKRPPAMLDRFLPDLCLLARDPVISCPSQLLRLSHSISLFFSVSLSLSLSLSPLASFLSSFVGRGR